MAWATARNPLQRGSPTCREAHSPGRGREPGRGRQQGTEHAVCPSHLGVCFREGVQRQLYCHLWAVPGAGRNTGEAGKHPEWGPGVLGSASDCPPAPEGPWTLKLLWTLCPHLRNGDSSVWPMM